MSDFTDRNILIVGGSTGIGLSLTRLLAGSGAHVITASRHQTDELEAISASFIPLDATGDLSALADLPDVIHGVAYCPGTINLKPFNRLTEQDFLNDFRINVLGAVRVLQAVQKNLKAANGASVVLFSTVAARLGMNYHASIAAAKGGVEGLTVSLAAEFAAARIRVNAIAPSLTDTPLAGNLLSTDEKREASGKRHPLGRVGTSEEVARVAAFLLSEESDWISGQIMGVDGGMSTLRPL